MTDYIIEMDRGGICEYVDDGIDQVVLITPKASVLRRAFREPSSYKKLMSTLSKVLPRP